MADDALPQASAMPPYFLRPATSDDVPLLQRWLQTPEVVRWWGEPEEQLGLIVEDFIAPEMVQWVVSLAERPFAYAQTYEVHVWPQAHLRMLPAGSCAIDSFIGEPDLIGRGHGSRFLRLLAERLTAAGAPIVAVDPAVDNQRARRAYQRAGFREEGLVQTPEGPSVLMIFTPPDFKPVSFLTALSEM